MKLIFASLLLSILIFLAGCSGTGKPAEAASNNAPEPLAVQTVAAENRVLDRTIPVTGSLLADETTTVSSEVPGRVERILVDFGHDVRKGQLLAQLDTQELRLAVERSKAALAQALARLGLEAGQENVRPDGTPMMRQALAQLEDAKSKFDNASRLVKSGDISQERFTEAQKQYEARKAAYEAARDDQRTVSAQVQALRAELRLAEKRLADATVLAPFDGTVSQKHVSPGQFLKENTPLLTLVKTWPLRLRLEVPETAAGTLRPGTTLRFRTDAAPDATFSATIQELNPSLDAQSRTLTAEARLRQADRRLRPGMFVQVELDMSKGNNAVVVPERALYSIAGLTKVFTIRDGRAVEHRVDAGQRIDGWVEVPREAISPGDRVAISELTQLVNGMPVRPEPKN